MRVVIDFMEAARQMIREGNWKGAASARTRTRTRPAPIVYAYVDRFAVYAYGLWDALVPKKFGKS
jgi:hypothetical protein